MLLVKRFPRSSFHSIHLNESPDDLQKTKQIFLSSSHRHLKSFVFPLKVMHWHIFMLSTYCECFFFSKMKCKSDFIVSPCWQISKDDAGHAALGTVLPADDARFVSELLWRILYTDINASAHKCFSLVHLWIIKERKCCVTFCAAAPNEKLSLPPFRFLGCYTFDES